MMAMMVSVHKSKSSKIKKIRRSKKQYFKVCARTEDPCSQAPILAFWIATYAQIHVKTS